MGLNWGFGDGQAGPCMGRYTGGAWHGAWVDDVVGGWYNCSCILPGLVRLDLGIGVGLV